MSECPPRSYGSFCPVAQASEVVAQRWVPLILREIMVGYHRFNEIRHALPLISPSVLSQRLKIAGGGRRDRAGGGSRTAVTYHLTPAGEELRPIVDALGHWARKWVTRDYRSYELDPGGPDVVAPPPRASRRSFPSGGRVVHFRLDGRAAAIGATGGSWC